MTDPNYRDHQQPNPKTAKRWPVGTRVRVTRTGWTGVVTKVYADHTGSGAIKVRWDDEWVRFGCHESKMSNPDLVFEKEEQR